ncbi:MAG: acetyl-CoA acetyltransferase [Pseudomonadota bacterium]
MPISPVIVLGGAQTDFARNWHREDLSFFDLFTECLESGLGATSLEPEQISVAHVGNFVGELFTGQGMLGGWFAHVDKRFAGMPASRHEGACASGSLAILSAMADIESGRYDVACVLGIEMMRNVPGKTAADYLGAAAFVGEEAQDATYVWPALFSDLAEAYEERYGLDRAHLAALARKNFTNARQNPAAQTRSWSLDDRHFSTDDAFNPVIEGHMRKHDCGQVTDGAAVVFLASPAFARNHAQRTGKTSRSQAVIEGWGHRNGPMKLATKLDAHSGEGYLFAHTRKAITDAYARAGVSGPEALDAIETHDCFSITEYMALEHFGLTPPGQAWRAIEDGTVDRDGALPVNPSGGLIGLGHPVGATGVRMLLDAYRQVTDTAGAMQVPGARRVGTYNVGGSGTTNCAFIVGQAHELINGKNTLC